MGACATKGRDLMTQNVSFGSLLLCLIVGQAASGDKLRKTPLTLSWSFHQIAQSYMLYVK